MTRQTPHQNTSVDVTDLGALTATANLSCRSVGAEATQRFPASAEKYHLGRITKQGSPLLRFVLGQAAAHAARMDPDLKRIYGALVHRRGRPKAKAAVARKLLVRLFIMLRDQIDYDEFRRRGRTALVAA
jgi:transposase